MINFIYILVNVIFLQKNPCLGVNTIFFGSKFHADDY